MYDSPDLRDQVRNDPSALKNLRKMGIRDKDNKPKAEEKPLGDLMKTFADFIEKDKHKDFPPIQEERIANLMMAHVMDQENPVETVKLHHEFAEMYISGQCEEFKPGVCAIQPYEYNQLPDGYKEGLTPADEDEFDEIFPTCRLSYQHDVKTQSYGYLDGEDGNEYGIMFFYDSRNVYVDAANEDKIIEYIEKYYGLSKKSEVAAKWQTLKSKLPKFFKEWVSETRTPVG